MRRRLPLLLIALLGAVLQVLVVMAGLRWLLEWYMGCPECSSLALVAAPMLRLSRSGPNQ